MTLPFGSFILQLLSMSLGHIITLYICGFLSNSFSGLFLSCGFVFPLVDDLILSANGLLGLSPKVISLIQNSVSISSAFRVSINPIVLLGMHILLCHLVININEM